MRPAAERRVVVHLAAGGFTVSDIADISAIPRSTVADWLRRPNGGRRAEDNIPGAALPQPAYSYLLGFYLGDGTISRHPRDVYRLRISTDVRYPGVIRECADAMQAVMPDNRVAIKRLPSRAVEINCYSKRWPLLFPQHGPGRKHERHIMLEPWQESIVARFPQDLIRGLIHSDGCRVANRVNGKDYPRYFSPRSPTTSVVCSARRAAASASSTRGATGRPCRLREPRASPCSTRS